MTEAMSKDPLLDFCPCHQWAAFSRQLLSYLPVGCVIEITVTAIANASKWIIEQL